MKIIFYFFIGSIFGSFAHLVCQRTIKEENIAFPPSHCTYCNKKIFKRDLIPIISYINLRGKCRFCHKKIPISYLIYEIIGGLLFIFAFNDNNLIQGIFIYLSLLISFIISVIDLKTLEINMIYVHILGILGIIYRIIYLKNFLEFIKIFIIFTFIFVLIYYLSKKNIGDGDYFFYISLFLFLENEKIIYLLLGSVWIGAIPAIYLAIKNKSTKIIMPFCPYIFLAYMIALL